MGAFAANTASKGLQGANEHERYMVRALELAARGAGWTNPNPQVGAVIVKDGRIIGEGWHTAYGKLHAEREALAHCTEDPRGATIYVTLEPCCHWGKTPPCTEAIIEAGIARVVVGAPDPNPLVAGKGFEVLREAGIEVVEGILLDECRAINEVFFHYIQTGLPLVIAKYAMTLDGKIATRTGASRWITSEVARAKVHEDRHRHAAIMVGIGTVLSDDPELTSRISDQKTKNPLRVVVDSLARTPLTSKIAQTAREIPTLIAVAAQAPAERIAALEETGCEVFVSPMESTSPASIVEQSASKTVAKAAQSAEHDRVDLPALLAYLGKEKAVDSVIVEGGATLLWSFFSENLVDRVQAYIAPKIFGGAGSPSPVQGLGVETPAGAIQCSLPTITRLGQDILLECEVLKCLPE